VSNGPVPLELLGASILIDLGELARLERSGILDPRVNTAMIREWMTRHTQRIKEWPRLGDVLVRLYEQPEQR
jgi:hypothetical protein